VIKNCSIVLLRVDDAVGLDRDYGKGAAAHAARRVASIVVQRVRGIDLVGQWKKDEVVVGLVGTSEFDASRITDDLRESIASLPVSFGRLRFSFTAAGGVSSADHAKSTAALITRARTALAASAKKTNGATKRMTIPAKRTRTRRARKA